MVGMNIRYTPSLFPAGWMRVEGITQGMTAEVGWLIAIWLCVIGSAIDW